MTKGVVVSLYLSGKGKKMFKSGDVVSSSDVENFTELVAKGYIKQIEENETESKTESDSVNSNALKELQEQAGMLDNEKQPLFVVERKGEKVNVYSEKDIHKAEIVALLTEQGADFDESDNKADLWDLLIK